MRALVKGAVQSASAGNVLAAAGQGGGGGGDSESVSEAEDCDEWHDAVDLPLEEVLQKWEEDQAATLQRLDRLMEVRSGAAGGRACVPRGAGAAPALLPPQLPRP